MEEADPERQVQRRNSISVRHTTADRTQTLVTEPLCFTDDFTARTFTHGPVHHAMVSFLQLDIALSGCNTAASILYGRGASLTERSTDLLLKRSITVKGRNCLHALPNAARLLRGGATCDAAWDASQPWLLYRSNQDLYVAFCFREIQLCIQLYCKSHSSAVRRLTTSN